MSIKPPTKETQFNWGLPLAFAVLGGWLAVHIFSVFFYELTSPFIWTMALIALQCWLYTGVFIVAHDTMHGSLAPRSTKTNAILGTVILFVYAGFNWKKMKAAHHAHHTHSGEAGDPDFNIENPKDFWPWYLKFFRQYFRLAQFLVVFGFTLAYVFIFGAEYLNTILMWAVPAILSSLQLFYFGTYLTHRHKEDFIDAHNARSNSYPKWLSLMSCFHFGYHHEHHLFPHEPWWRLPARKFQKVKS